MEDNLVPLVIALVGATGLGGLLREGTTAINRYRSGVSSKEANRKRDLVAERDYEYDRAESEARNRRRLEEYSAMLRRQLIENCAPADIPRWPNLEEIPERTIDRPPETTVEK